MQHDDFMAIFPPTLTLPRQGGGNFMVLLQEPLLLTGKNGIRSHNRMSEKLRLFTHGS